MLNSYISFSLYKVKKLLLNKSRIFYGGDKYINLASWANFLY